MNFLSHTNIPRPDRRLVQYTRIIGSRNIKDSDVDINIPAVYQHGVVVPSKIGERVTNILPWARRSFENMARISLTGLELFDNTLWYTKGIFYSLLHTRLAQTLIPIPIPDPINAPVQHMLLQDTARCKYRETRMYRSYTEEDGKSDENIVQTKKAKNCLMVKSYEAKIDLLI